MYFFLISFVFCTCFFRLSSENVLRSNAIFCFLFFSLVMGYGTDWIYYKQNFDNIDLSQIFNFEPFYSIIVLFIKSFELNYQWVHITTTFIGVFFLYLYSSKFNNKNLIFIIAISIFGIMLFLAQERQGVAVCIFLYSTKIINKKRKYLLIFIAIMFHYSAIVCLFYYYLKNKNDFKLFKYFFVFNFSILCVYIAFSVGLINYIPFIPDVLTIKIEKYLSEGIFDFSFSFGYLLNIIIIMYMFVIYYGDRKSEKYKRGLFFSVIFFELRLSPLFLYRFNYYFLPFFFEAIDEYVMRSKYKFNINILLLFFMLYGLRVYITPVSRVEINQAQYYLFNNVDYSILEYKSCNRNLDNKGNGRGVCEKKYWK